MPAIIRCPSFKRFTDYAIYNPIKKAVFIDLFHKNVRTDVSWNFALKTIKGFSAFIVNRLMTDNEGVILPKGLGKIAIIGVIPNWPVKDARKTKDAGKTVYHNNYHTDGYLYKLYYFWNRSAKANEAYAKYQTRGLWAFRPLKSVKYAIRDTIRSGNTVWDKVASKTHINKTIIN